MEYIIDKAPNQITVEEYLDMLTQTIADSGEYHGPLSSLLSCTDLYMRDGTAEETLKGDRLDCRGSMPSWKTEAVRDITCLATQLARKGNETLRELFKGLRDYHEIEEIRGKTLNIGHFYGEEIEPKQALSHLCYYALGGNINVHSEFPVITVCINASLERQFRVFTFISTMLLPERTERTRELFDLQSAEILTVMMEEDPDLDVRAVTNGNPLDSEVENMTNMMYAGHNEPFYGKTHPEVWLSADDMRVALLGKYITDGNTLADEKIVEVRVSYRTFRNLMAGAVLANNAKLGYRGANHRQAGLINTIIDTPTIEKVTEVSIDKNKDLEKKLANCKILLSDTIDNKTECDRKLEIAEKIIRQMEIENNRLVSAMLDDSQDDEGETTDTSNIFSYRVTFVSTNPTTGNGLIKEYPNIRYIEVRNDRFDVTNIADTDLIVFDKLRVPHSTYFRLQKGLRGKDVPLLITSNTNSEMLANEISKALERVS